MSAAPAEVRQYDAELVAAVEAVFEGKGLSFDAKPAYVSHIPGETNIAAALKGAELMGLPITPQGCYIAGVLEAKNAFGLPLYDEVGVEVPRRSTKTTTIQFVLLGRCALRPGYRVVSTAQDGTRASQFFANMMRTIESTLVRRGLTKEDVGIKTFYHSQGREYIEWLNGSKWWVVKPESSAFRGDAADCMWFDEAGELNAEKSDDLQAGALPLMDTRDDAQVIVSGTPSLARQGMFWETLEAGRKDPAATGIVDFAASEYDDPADEALWWRVHPGLASGLTTIEKMRKRFEKMPITQFAREYLCIWPPDSTVTALDITNWDATLVEHLASPPEGVPWGIGWDVAIGGSAAAVAVAWIDEDDEPHIQVMEHRAGSQWVAKNIAAALLKHPRVPVGYDNIGDNITVAQALGRMPKLKRPKLKALNLKEVAAATSTLAQANDRLALHHAEHPGLDTAVRNTTWREAGGSRLFMRGKGREISCLLACVHALAVASTAQRRGALSLPSAK